jgi:hypothetical protein
MHGIEIHGKAEYFNPGGSVKDRPAFNMIRDGERSGKLDETKTLLDSTSGNTGIAYAMICAAKGYKVKLCLPANASHERKRILKAYGAEIVFTDPAEGSDGAIRKCREIFASDPDRYFYPDQYNNPANWQAHFETTGPEIISQTHGRITHFVTSLGTSGTFMGVTRSVNREKLAGMYFSDGSLTDIEYSLLNGLSPIAYATLSQMSRDCSDSRVYGGVHLNTSTNDGMSLGHDVATFTFGAYPGNLTSTVAAALQLFGSAAAAGR